MLVCSQVGFSYTAEREIITDFSYTFPANQRVTLVWPNGCGKSTLLQLLAWLLVPTRGMIQRSSDMVIGYVFQSYREALFPWLSVEKNLLLPLRALGYKPDEAHRSVGEVLSGYLPLVLPKTLAGRLSGGQQQMLCILRALVLDANVLLLDEPCSALDTMAKEMVYALLQRIVAEKQMTVIMVTHEQQEAWRLSDKVLLFGDQWLQICKEQV